jgi:surfactin synthase thioesterase subunit
MMPNVWFPYKNENGERRCKLYCFNHAGGSSLIFKDWINLDESIEVIPVEIPGRRKRMSEKCRTDFQELINETAEQVLADAGADKVFVYGHSMGAVMAFSLAEILEKKYCKRVEGLFVAGRQAPADEDTSPYRTTMGMDSLRDELIRLGDTPKELLDDKTFMDFYLPVIYSDYKLSENYLYDGNNVSCPVYAMCGDTDISADIETMKRWQDYTNNTFSLMKFRGGHFFAYNESTEEVRKYIADHIKDSI